MASVLSDRKGGAFLLERKKRGKRFKAGKEGKTQQDIEIGDGGKEKFSTMSTM